MCAVQREDKEDHEIAAKQDHFKNRHRSFNTSKCSMILNGYAVAKAARGRLGRRL
jgi:hypothetical protein